MYSPDSEQMEPAKPLGLKAELCERGANPRQREEFQVEPQGET